MYHGSFSAHCYAYVSNFSSIAAESGERNLRIFITTDTYPAIYFPGCTLTTNHAKSFVDLQ